MERQAGALGQAETGFPIMVDGERLVLPERIVRGFASCLSEYTDCFISGDTCAMAVEALFSAFEKNDPLLRQFVSVVRDLES